MNLSYLASLQTHQRGFGETHNIRAQSSPSSEHVRFVRAHRMTEGDSALRSQLPTRSSVSAAPIGTLPVVAAWFGIFAGLAEGAGLLLFQRINWAQWGRLMHVSKEVLWISPLVDLFFFYIVTLLAWLISRCSRRVPAIRLLVFLLTFLTIYDWLTLTNRLYHRACLILALGVAVAFTRWIAKREAASVAFWRRSTPWLAVVFLLAFSVIQGGKWAHERIAVAKLPATPQSAPNVLVFVLDTLRADHLSSYGYSRATSPEIDRIASRGVLFENAIAPCSWSLPSHASLLTGRSPSEHGMQNAQPMPWWGWGKNSLGGYPTLGDVLKERGYRTGAFSANRVYFTRNVGLGRGFIHFEDYFDSVGDSFVRTLYGREFARLYLNRTEKSKLTRALRYLGLESWLDKDSEGSGDFGGAYGVRKRASVVNQEVLQWIDRDRRDPFFVFLNYLDVHYAYGGPRGYPKPDWDKGTTIDEYDAGLKYVDDYIGRLLRELEQRGLERNTIVIITSDHGESLGAHGLTYHGAALYRELIQVPLVISYPQQIPRGLRVKAPVSNTAIAATIMDLLGASDQGAFPGPPLSALWKSPKVQTKWPDPISELAQTDIIVPADRVVEGKIPIATNGWMRSVVTPRWHLITHEKLGHQLYDWTNDPDESRNLIDTTEGRATALRLAGQFDAGTKAQ
jgi:arylsulfatase A-like enzyme